MDRWVHMGGRCSWLCIRKTIFSRCELECVCTEGALSFMLVQALTPHRHAPFIYGCMHAWMDAWQWLTWTAPRCSRRWTRFAPNYALSATTLSRRCTAPLRPCTTTWIPRRWTGCWLTSVLLSRSSTALPVSLCCIYVYTVMYHISYDLRENACARAYKYVHAYIWFTFICIWPSWLPSPLIVPANRGHS